MRKIALAALILATGQAPPVMAATLEVRGPQDGGFTAHVVSVKEARFTTTQRQQYDFSCGSAALATLLMYHYGDRQSEQSVFLGMWQEGDRAQIRRLGFSLLDMKRYLARRGLQADGYRVELEQIARAALPGIALIDMNGYKHFVVVKGVQGGTVLLGDPSLGIRRLDAQRFREQWNGVYFVLDAKPRGRAAEFGAADEWALAPAGRPAQLALPVSLQALALTRPLPGEI